MTTCVFCGCEADVSCTICDSLLCADHGTSVFCQVGGDAERVCEDREACRMIAGRAATCDVCGLPLKDNTCQTFDCPESSQFSDWADSWHDDVDRSDPLDALVEEMELDAP